MRTISLLTILALLYCPLACAVGQGYGVSSQLADGLETAMPVCCCCSSKTTPADPADSDRSQSKHKDCQGICSGAVQDRHDATLDLAATGLLALDPVFPQVALAPTIIRHNQDRSLSDANVLSGRQLRTLFLGLIC
ncbi:hypothetical protein AB1K70_11290 [Bremerella sp. JC770]|uniref:hypothetical protein n=1 Tax=Bremerella sp. JC770 TaxID=3232137 RepID=UPI003459A76A